MGHQFAQIAFTPSVREIQSLHGSRKGYAGMDEGEDYNRELGEGEAAFIAARDSFYMASVSETGWPYLQHRGGPAGFIKILDTRTLGFADYAGNRQYISTGNFSSDNRVALFFMDYPNRRRLKLLGRVRIIGTDDQETLIQLEDDHYRARIERGFVIRVEAFDWNCPQHITPRYSEAEVEARLKPLVTENEQLRAGRPATTTELPTVLGDGELELVISGVRQLAEGVRAYELRDPNGRDLPQVSAGAHLQVPVMLDDGEVVTRHYSIASNPARRDLYEIAVRLEAEGAGGSRAVHEHYRIGLRLRTAMPANHFTLHDDERPAILFAGGIGITPIKAMAQTLAARGTEMQLHYTGRSRSAMPYRDRLQRAFGERIRVYASDEDARLDIASTLAQAPANAVIYVCGPARLIDGVLAAARNAGMAADRVRFERFSAEADADAKAISVRLARSRRIIQVEPDQSILDAILEAGIQAPYSCRTGNCKACAMKVLDGEPEHRDGVLSDEERSEQRLMCPCVSRARTDNLVLDF